MLTYAVIIFAITAVGGIVLATSLLKGNLAPWAISIIHAILGATGLVLVLVAILQGNGSETVKIALGLLVIAALGGFYLVAQHLRKTVAEKKAVIVHASVAVAGFLTLLYAAFMG